MEDLESVHPYKPNEISESLSINIENNNNENDSNGKSSSPEMLASDHEMRLDNAVTVKLESVNANHISNNQEENSAVEMPDKRRSEISISEVKTSKPNTLNTPGVILLGRGNSFSLGRSEVILLHNRPERNKRDGSKKKSWTGKHLHSISEHAGSKEAAKIPSSPPPISEMALLNQSAHTNGWHRIDTSMNEMRDDETIPDEDDENDNEDDENDNEDEEMKSSLNNLWLKAEEVMAARQSRVLKVLEEFGIGEPGGGEGGGDDGGHSEEEQVWQIVQDSFHGQH